MSIVTLNGNTVTIHGGVPSVGERLPEFTLVGKDLAEKTLDNYEGKQKIINIFPSIDTGVCSTAAHRFNELATEVENTVVMCVSKDLPFALKRFCGDQGLENIETLSAFRSSFAKDYGVELLDSKLAGLCTRAVFVADENNVIIHTEIVSEITTEPNYGAALNALNKLQNA